MSDDSKVVPMFPEIPQAAGIKATGLPYTTPTKAIEEILRLNNFDEAVKNQDWVEIRLIAKFSDIGAIFHTVQARSVEMVTTPNPATPPSDPVDDPAHRVLTCMAGDNGLPGDYFYGKATIAQMDALNAALADATDEELITLAAGEDTERDELIKAKGWQNADSVLSSLFNGG